MEELYPEMVLLLLCPRVSPCVPVCPRVSPLSPLSPCPSCGRGPFKSPRTALYPTTTSGSFVPAPSTSSNGQPAPIEARELCRFLLAALEEGVAAFSHAPGAVGAPRGRDGAGAAAERLQRGQRGVRGVPPGVPRAPGAVPGLAAGGAAVPGDRRAQRHVPGHLLQGRAALGPHGAAEGAGPRRAALLHQLREQEGPGAGLQPLRLPGLLLGAALPPGAHRGLGAAPARGGIRSLLPEPAQGQPDRGPGQPAELGHPRPRVPAEEERGAGGAVPGQGRAPAGLLGRVPGGAGGGGVLAGPIEPAARPDRVPAGPGPRGAARGHDAPGPRRLGLRAPLALSPPLNVPKECPQGMSPGVAAAPPCPSLWAGEWLWSRPQPVCSQPRWLINRVNDRAGSGWDPSDPLSPSPSLSLSLSLAVGWGMPSELPSPRCVPKSVCSRCQWLINRVNDRAGSGWDPSDPLWLSLSLSHPSLHVLAGIVQCAPFPVHYGCCLINSNRVAAVLASPGAVRPRP